jgi:hypothetical protein
LVLFFKKELRLPLFVRIKKIRADSIVPPGQLEYFAGESSTGDKIMMGVKRATIPSALVVVALLAVTCALAGAAPDRYTLRVPGGLAFAEFRGYDQWQTIAVSQNGNLIETILGNQAMVEAFKAGAPGNGKPFPNGARMAKIHWKALKNTAEPGNPTLPGALDDIDFMVKDSKRFADSGGWGYAVFEYNATTDTFRPGNLTDEPPQAHDAKCGFACHTLVSDKDYVFTAYPKR